MPRPLHNRKDQRPRARNPSGPLCRTNSGQSPRSRGRNPGPRIGHRHDGGRRHTDRGPSRCPVQLLGVQFYQNLA
jgi:hypothetical protein